MKRCEKEKRNSDRNNYWRLIRFLMGIKCFLIKFLNMFVLNHFLHCYDFVLLYNEGNNVLLEIISFNFYIHERITLWVYVIKIAYRENTQKIHILKNHKCTHAWIYLRNIWYLKKWFDCTFELKEKGLTKETKKEELRVHME